MVSLPKNRILTLRRLTYEGNPMIPKRRFRIPALVFAAASMLAAGFYLYLFALRALRFWGAGAALAAAISAAFASLCLCALVIRPIPVKFTAVAALHLLAFGLFFDLLSLAAEALGPAGVRLTAFNNSGVPALALSAALLLYGWLNVKRVAKTYYRVPVSAPLPGGKLRVAMLSDLHMGRSIGAERLRRVCARISAEAPDVLLLAGDLCDDQTTPSDMLAACALLGGIPTVYGAYFVFGNHDLGGHGPALKYPAGSYRAALCANGITVLDDVCVFVSGAFTIAGRRDAWMARASGGRIPLADLLCGADASKPVFLLDHQPLDTKEAARQGVTLQLSGHTHAGQVFPASLLGRLLPTGDVFYGHKRVGGCHVVVSSGLGCRGSRLRSGSRAEYVIVDLESFGR